MNTAIRTLSSKEVDSVAGGFFNRTAVAVGTQAGTATAISFIGLGSSANVNNAQLVFAIAL
jgi:hypothetical protein